MEYVVSRGGGLPVLGGLQAEAGPLLVKDVVMGVSFRYVLF